MNSLLKPPGKISYSICSCGSQIVVSKFHYYKISTYNYLYYPLYYTSRSFWHVFFSVSHSFQTGYPISAAGYNYQVKTTVHNSISDNTNNLWNSPFLPLIENQGQTHPFYLV